MNNSDALVDALSMYAHNAWSGWMQYMFGKSIRDVDGAMLIPSEYVERWERQSQTAYSELPLSEQVSDQDEALKILAILRLGGFEV